MYNTNQLLIVVTIDQVRQRCTEIGGEGFQFRHPGTWILEVLRVVLEYLFDAAPASFHDLQPFAHVRKKWIAANGRHATDIEILQIALARHPARRCDFKPVVKDIHMDFTSSHEVVSMYECVDERLVNGPLWILHELYACPRQLVPSPP